MAVLDRKERLALPPQPIPKQEPRSRVGNWDEVYLPFDLETARAEAMRCIQCPAAPCTKACPLHNYIPAALALLEDGDAAAAAAVIRLTSPMPEICSRLCPQEKLCQGKCVVGKKSRPVAIGRLEAFVAGFPTAAEPPVPAAASGHRVAVVGAGPAGLTVAESLAVRGHAVEVYDAWPAPGGLLTYGIPSFKLEKHVLDRVLERLAALGVVFHGGVQLDSDDVEELFTAGFEAVFLGHGACLGRRLRIPGEELDGVHLATPFLARLNVRAELLPEGLAEPSTLGEGVVVIGGGDTAMDCARSAVRAGASSVDCFYRRTESEMPGRAEERRNAEAEGVRFTYLAAPVAILPDEAGGRVARVRFQLMELGEPDASGRRRPVAVPGSEFDVPATTVVLAAGYDVDPRPLEGVAGAALGESGTVVADEGGATGRPGLFAAGDNVRGADLVVTAVADAKRAGAAIDAYLAGVG